MNHKECEMSLESIRNEMKPVITIPAPGGELSISSSKRIDETERLENARNILLGMLETQADTNSHSLTTNTTLLPSNKTIAEGVAKVAEELNDVIRHRETTEGIKRLNSFWMNPWVVGFAMLIFGFILGRFIKV